MARVPFARIEQTPQKIKDFFAKLEKNGRVLNVQKMVANSPGAVREFTRLGNALLMKAKLSDYFRELAIIRVSFLTGSLYEWTQHVPIALRAGVTKEQLEEINVWRESSLFAEEDRVILQFTDEVVQEHQPKDATFNLAAKFLDPESLVELTLSIGYWSMVGKFLRTFQVEIEESVLQDIGHLLPKNKPA
jgi:4-carboxymuconolactone decarboxylase